MLLQHLTRLLLLLSVVQVSSLQAQEPPPTVAPWSGFGVEVNPCMGKVFKHNVKFKMPIPEHSYGADVNFVMHTYGKKAWQQRRNYPILGLSITYTNYGIDSIYGQCIGITPNIILPLVTFKNLQWTMRIGDGIGYVTRHYNRNTPVDTINKAIGSHINDFAYFSTDIRYHINNQWDAQLGAHFTHISDASFRKPNLGVNMYGGHVGLTYYPVTSRPARIKRNLPPLKNRWLAQARVSMAMVSAHAPGGPLYPVYIASAFASKRWISKNKAFIGIDYSYHNDVYAFLRTNEIYPGEERKHSYKSAVFFGNEFLLGRVGAVLQVGVYIKQAALKYDPYYEKIGGHFYIVKRDEGQGAIKELFISAFLKTHKTIAELGEIGLGVGF